MCMKEMCTGTCTFFKLSRDGLFHGVIQPGLYTMMVHGEGYSVRASPNMCVMIGGIHASCNVNEGLYHVVQVSPCVVCPIHITKLN